MAENENAGLPGEKLDTRKMPGHWLLARLGKRVLRPGGIEMTYRMLDELDIQSGDAVVEFAPGLGQTAELVLERGPASYTGIERDATAAERLQGNLYAGNGRCIVGRAEESILPECCATVAFGEAILSMQPQGTKRRIVQEAYRILKEEGRYALHELCILPEDISADARREIESALGQEIHVGVRPLSPLEWRALLESEGFSVTYEGTAPMHLLEPKRLIDDEGLLGALSIGMNILRDRDARERVLRMRDVFRRYHENLAAIVLVGVKGNIGGEAYSNRGQQDD